MRKQDFKEELFKFPYNSFLHHLQRNGNDRILFSGKFGIGKTFFLGHFFNETTQEAQLGLVKYRAFHLYPINYSIASNEDVFRYLKYDIITSMLINKVELKENDFSFIDAVPSYVYGNLLKIFATLIYMIPKIGKDVEESHEKLIELKKDFEKYDKRARTSEGDMFVEYLETLEEKEGSPFENNVITKLISKVLTRLKEETKQENILIIDDLDRIDPEHLFRLLNVFAAHLDDSKGTKNKLGFDKVIIVCDINNLRNIFKTKYGIQTDFNGYIDKFYSLNVYNFDNRKILENISYDAFKNVSFTDSENQTESYYQAAHFREPNLPLILLRTFIYYGFISLRTLLNKLENKIEFDTSYYLKFDDMSIVNQTDNSLFVHFKILKEIVGDYDILKDYLNRIPLKGFDISNLNKYSNQMLYFVYYNQTLRATGQITIHFNNSEFCLQIPENYLRNRSQHLLLFKPNAIVVQGDPPQYNYTIKEFHNLLIEFIDLLKRIEN